MLGLRRVVIVPLGVGNTTFSRLPAKSTKLPIFHLDDLYWKPNWVPQSQDEWAKKIGEIISG